MTKSNAQRHAMVMWDEIAAKVAAEFPDVTWDKTLVDAMTMRMVIKPQTLDTIVATNLHADILSDLAADLGGYLRRDHKEVFYMQSVAIEGPPCEAMSPHGYLGIEAATVERITQWIGATTGR